MPLINHKACCTSSYKPTGSKEFQPGIDYISWRTGIKATIMNKRGFNGQRSVGQHSRVREQRDKSVVRKPSAFIPAGEEGTREGTGSCIWKEGSGQAGEGLACIIS